MHPKQNTIKDLYKSRLLHTRRILKNVPEFNFNYIFAELGFDLNAGTTRYNIICLVAFWKLCVLFGSCSLRGFKWESRW